MTDPTNALSEPYQSGRLKPCPFCNTDMSVMNQRVWHPPFECILYSFSFEDSVTNRQSWNRRAKI